MIQFHSNNFMLKKTINRMAFKNYVPKPLSLVNVLDSDDNFMRYYDSYSDDLEESVNKNGIFLVLASLEHNMFKRAKRINENDDKLDKYSVNNLFNPTLIKFMHDGLSFKTNL